jgi:tetratricopeptide (TPR) repeat protein
MTTNLFKKNQLMFLLSVILVGYLTWPMLPAWGNDTKCNLALKISTTAAEMFAKDKKEGIRLFLKALDYCPESSLINFNTGLAFYRYGNSKEAEKYLRKAAENDSTDINLLNLLAWVLLENGSDPFLALASASKAVFLYKIVAVMECLSKTENLDKSAASECENKAEKLDEYAPLIDTWIRAWQATGDLDRALSEAKEAYEKWPKNEKIADRHEKTLNSYRIHYLLKAEEGNKEEALAGLRIKEGYPIVKNDICWVIFKSGLIVEALEEADKGIRAFGTDAELKNTFSEIADQYIRKQYQDFEAGRKSAAINSVDAMKKKYPSHRPFTEAYDKLYTAILAEVDKVGIPDPLPIASSGKPGSPADDVLGRIKGRGASPGIEIGALVDVDNDIPKGTIKRPNGIAVIIGNGRYSKHSNGIPDVTYAYRDAAYMKIYVVETLGFMEENVIYEQDATQATLNTIFGRGKNYKGKLYNWVKPGQSDVFIYYTGHGAPDTEGKGSFLVPVDADVDYITSTGYSLAMFYRNLGKVREKIGKGKITVILDACFSGDSAGGFLFRNISPALIKTTSPVGDLQEAVIFTSAGESEVSHWYPDMQHSLFTYFFMKGLRGDADIDKNRVITVGEMRDYLKDRVSYRALRLGGREQNPIIIGDESLELVSFR